MMNDFSYSRAQDIKDVTAFLTQNKNHRICEKTSTLIRAGLIVHLNRFYKLNINRNTDIVTDK
jgi:hypothetical protein